ncbi:MAG: sel1 repeat family protein [Treponema sp.]|nr:sel1 repeat family protein [Candidatus Treponema equifaecale]
MFKNVYKRKMVVFVLGVILGVLGTIGAIKLVDHIMFHKTLIDLTLTDDEIFMNKLPLAEKGDIEAIHFVGNYYKSKKEYEKAIECYEKSLAAGKLDSACQLGTFYYFGNGVSVDYQKAIKLFELCLSDDKMTTVLKDKANFYLGLCYYYGNGVEQDRNKGLNLILDGEKELMKAWVLSEVENYLSLNANSEK